jgi:hypothetical protein
MERNIIRAIDTCGTMEPEQYAFLLQQAKEQLDNSEFLPVFNFERERVVQTETTVINFGKTCEELLAPELNNSLALCIVVSGDISQKKKKRAGALPDGVKYEGSGFPGRQVQLAEAPPLAKAFS